MVSIASVPEATVVCCHEDKVPCDDSGGHHDGAAPAATCTIACAACCSAVLTPVGHELSVPSYALQRVEHFDTVGSQRSDRPLLTPPRDWAC
jgi:hypothetical protein